MRPNLAGRDLTAWMVKLLTERGREFSTSAEREIVRLIKERLCFVALDYEAELAIASWRDGVDRTYDLPDRNVIKVGSERFSCPLMLFKPQFDGV